MGILEVLLGFVVLLSIIVILILLFVFNRPYSCNRKVKGNETVFTLDAKKPIAGIEIVGKFGDEKIKFQRKDIKKGEKIEFVYPASTEPASVTLEMEKGKPKTFEV